jgi:DNA-binding MarR family transcriptional regulator
MPTRRTPALPRKSAAERRTVLADGAAIDREGSQYQQMLTVLKQFRAVIANLKEHYQGVEEATGVSGTQLWALYAIATRPGLKVGDLARELAVHQSTASNLLDRLTELGYVVRKREGTDQRVVTLHLTSEGKTVVDRAPKPAIGVLQQALLSLPQDRLSGLHGHLNELIKAIGLKRVSGAATPLSISLGLEKSRR